MKRFGVESTLLILIGLCLAAAEDPFFRTQPADTTVNEGETAVLRCKVSDLSSVHYVQWVKDGIAITHPNRTRNINRLRNICNVREPTRYSVVGDFAHGEFNLEIVHTIASEDEDSYRCIVFDDFGPVLFSSDVELTVRTQSAASYPVCLPTTVRDAYVAGDVLHTECLFRNAEPLPELSWSRNNRRVSAGELIYPSLPDKKRDWVLTAEDDGAVITCQATGPSISNSQACVIGPLVVHYPPIVTVMPEIADVSVHDSAMFTCSVTANPKTDAYFWQTNGNPIDLSTGRFSLSPNGKDLTISKLTIFDDGLIVTCIVGNVIGQTSASAVLYILEAPAGPSTQRNVILTETPEREDSDPSTTTAPPARPRPKPGLPTAAPKTSTAQTGDPDSELVFAGSDKPQEKESGLALSVPVLAAVVTGSAIFAIVLVVLVCELTRWNSKRRKNRREVEEQRVTGYYDVNLSTTHQEEECKQKVNEWLKKAVDEEYYLIGTDHSLTIKLSRAGSTGQISNLSSLESGRGGKNGPVDVNTQNQPVQSRNSVSSNAQRHHYDEIANYTERGEVFTDGTDSGVSGHVYSIPIEPTYTGGTDYYHPTTIPSPSKIVNYDVIDTQR